MPVLNSHSEHYDSGFKTMDIAQEDAKFLQQLLKGELQRNRALVEIANLRKLGNKGVSSTTARPLMDILHQYPLQGVDLDNIVTYPPKMEPIPVKPLFLDVAWNYVQYPLTSSKAAATKMAETEKQQLQPAKKGWFGFGRG